MVSPKFTAGIDVPTSADLFRPVSTCRVDPIHPAGEVQSATSLGTQLPWKPNGTRGRCTVATGSSLMVDAS